MTKREQLIKNCIRLLQLQVCLPTVSSEKIDPKLLIIKELQDRIKPKKKIETVFEEDLFGKKINYPDGTKRWISNNW